MSPKYPELVVIAGSLGENPDVFDSLPKSCHDSTCLSRKHPSRDAVILG